jgi:hypothetical protein
MGYIVLSVEDLHILEEAENYELSTSGGAIKFYDEDAEELALFNFDNVVHAQPATDEEIQELIDDLGL